MVSNSKILKLIFYLWVTCTDKAWADLDGGSGSDPALKITKIGFPSNMSVTIKIPKPAFNCGPLLAHQRNAISMAFRRRADAGIRILSAPSPQLKTNKQKRCQCWTPSNKTFWIRACKGRNFLPWGAIFSFKISPKEG